MTNAMCDSAPRQIRFFFCFFVFFFFLHVHVITQLANLFRIDEELLGYHSFRERDQRH